MKLSELDGAMELADDLSGIRAAIDALSVDGSEFLARIQTSDGSPAPDVEFSNHEIINLLVQRRERVISALYNLGVTQ
jgi:hypothetical protein